MRNPDLHFTLPYGSNGDAILGWSSFPSDNAALFFGISMALFLVNRRAGLLAFVQTLVCVTIPRVYEGWHYPSDILAGGIIGCVTVSLTCSPACRRQLAAIPMRLLELRPQFFYATSVIMLVLTATTFEPLYPLAHAIVRLGASKGAATETSAATMPNKGDRLKAPSAPSRPANSDIQPLL